MSERLELPKIDTLPEVILFHRDHPGQPQIVLQIPNEDRTNAETYVLRTDRASDVVWLNALPNARHLRDTLGVEQHVAFFTESGHTQVIQDLDAPTATEEVVQQARMYGAPRRFDQDRRAAAARRYHHRQTPSVSPLRRYLGSRLW